jgi:hypothetical protein
MRLEVKTEEPTPPPKQVVLTLTEEEATELVTIFWYQVGGHWLLRDNMPGSVRLIEKLEAAGFRHREDWDTTRESESSRFGEPLTFKPFKRESR